MKRAAALNRWCSWMRRKHAPGPVDDLHATSITGGLWGRGEALGLADSRCKSCHGLGMVFGQPVSLGFPRRGFRVCRCVFRAVFRRCFRRYKDPRIAECSRKREEYRADVYLSARRELRGLDWEVFQLRYLRGWDWKRCTREIGIDRGLFFHRVYRVQEKLGRAWRELVPFGLFPVDEYFHSRVHSRMEFQGGRNGNVSNNGRRDRGGADRGNGHRGRG